MKPPLNPGRPGTAQRGVALITALLVVALATVTAVAMTSAQQLEVRRTGNLLHADQAYMNALGIEDWARGALLRDLVADTERGQRADGRREAWAQPLPITQVPGGTLRGRIEDLQGRFNLNNLALAEDFAAELAYFQRLLTILELEPALAGRIADWLDADIDARFPDGAEDLQYLRAEPPYRAANAPMAHPSELQFVEGVTPEVFARLAPYVTALPEATAVNVNTAPEPVLEALHATVAGSLREVIARRQERTLATIEDFFAAAGLEDAGNGEIMSAPELRELADDTTAPTPPDAAAPAARTPAITALVGVSSDYFAVHGDARIDRLDVRLESIVARTGVTGPRVIARSRRAY